MDLSNVSIIIKSEQWSYSLKNIASKQNISEQYLEQIFSSLKKSGLVQSVRGAQGGYLLSKEPKDITL